MPSAMPSKTSVRAVRLRDYRYRGELLSLCLTFLILVGLYAAFTVFFPATWSVTFKTLLVTISGLAVYIFTVKLQHRAAFGTLVRVSSRQFPELFETANEAAERLSADYVPVYVKRASEMNIYTLGLWQRPLIVVTSSLVDQMPPDALQFFIGREIGHVQAGHTWLRTLLKPLGSDVPVIGKLLNSVIFGDWMNRTAFTADRAGFIACRSLTTSVSTMLKFGVGVRLYEQLDIREFLDQINEVHDVRGHLTEIIAEQPYLVQRVRSLVKYGLSPVVDEIVPTRRDRTGILKDLPSAFVNTAGLKVASGNTGENLISTTHRRQSPDKIADVQVDDGDAVTQELEDDTALDARFWLRAEDGSTYQLRQRLTRIGRNVENDIIIESDRVSRFHAQIERTDAGFVITDLKSRNGVTLNGKKIAAPKVIAPGDKLRIGRKEFTFASSESDNAAPLERTVASDTQVF